MYELGSRFKLVRNEKGVTQKQAALGVGIHERLYQEYEYGKKTPSALTLIALADFFDVSLDYLVGRSETKERQP